MFEHNDIEFKEWLPECFRILKDGSHCYIMVNDRNVQEMLNEATKAGFKLLNILIWEKNNATPNKYYMKSAEFILFFRKGFAKSINNMGTKTVIKVNNIIGNKLHPSEKPVELFKILINNSSREGETVLDPFAGSGTTALACLNTNRNFICIEKDENYFNISQERIKNQKKEKKCFMGFMN
jgi:site-specific DNA-methyltransferase (adenine-specific)